jgi:DNA-binding beta-propeller fold protein YncE
MSEEAIPVALPLSSVQGPIGELIAQGMLSPPSRPGVLAVLDRFEIVRELGRGGMGVVLLGRDPGTGQEVAIKLVRSDLAGEPRAVQRFVKEAGHLKRLRHANVVPVLEISDRPRRSYFVMPYFERGSLASRLKPGQALEPEAILELAIPVAEGLSFAHRRGIIHRDLKPANLLLAADGGVCLADFGLARSLFNDTLVDVEGRQWEGTATYMSPAVAAGEAEDTRCDIYAFGALLYEMLTGRPPYQGERTKEILDQIRAGPPKPISSLNPKADEGLAAIATGALERELRDRYAEMQDIVADLHRVRQGLPPLGPRGAGRKARPMLTRVRRVARVLWIPACLAAVAAMVWMLRPASGPGRRAAPATGPPLEQRAGNGPADHAQGGVPRAQPAQAHQGPLGVPAERKPPERGIPGPEGGVPGLWAGFQTPWGIAADREGNVFVTDKDRAVVWKVTPTGVVTNLAGMPGNPGTGDGLGGDARFVLPRGIAVDKDGNLYVADAYRLREVTPWGSTSRFPKRGEGPGSETSFGLPSGIAVDREGNVFVADRYTIQKITPDGQVTTLAGRERHAGNEDGTGDKAEFSDMEKGLALDGAGNLYVGDMRNHAIRKITPAGKVLTLAGPVQGGPVQAGSTDGRGSEARFSRPCGLAVDSAGKVYVADSGNHTIRLITPEGVVSTFAGVAGKAGRLDGAATNALFNTPMGVALDGAGNVYVADTGNSLVRKITVAGQVVSVGRPADALAGAVSAPRSAAGVWATLPETVQRCVHLARAGVGEQVILAFAREDRNGPFKLSDDQIIYLEDQGVSENVIVALMPPP